MKFAFCIGDFWHENLTWPIDDNPPTCSKQIILWSDVIIFIFAIFLWSQMIYKRKNEKYRLPFSSLFAMKMIFAFLFLLLQIIVIVYSIWFFPPLNDLTPILFLLTTLILLCYTNYQQSIGTYSSGYLFCYWYLVCVSILPDLMVITLKYRPISIKQHIYIWLNFLFAFASFLTHCFAEKPHKWNKNDQNIMPEPYETVPSRLAFSWVNQLIFRARRKPLTEDDWWDLQASDRTDTVVEQVQTYLNSNDKKDTKQSRRTLCYALFCAFKETLALGGLLKLVVDLLALSTPLVLKVLLKYFNNNSNSIWFGIFLAVLLSFIIFSQTMFFQTYIHDQTYFSLYCRSAIAGLIYRKSLKLSNAARQEASTGEIVNLMSFDASRLSALGSFIHLIWSSPLQMILALILLYREMKYSMLPGGILLLIFIPLNIILNRYRRILVQEQMILKDSRVEMMNELLNGIKVIKLYGWEPVFINRINIIREKELSITRKRTIITAASTILCTFAPILLAMVTFATYVFSSTKNILTAEKAFVSLSIFNLLRTPIMLFPYIVGSLVEATVSNERIKKFLAKEEIDPHAVERIPNEINSTSPMMTITNGTFQWSKCEMNSFILKNINLDVQRRTLVALVGSVGSGKSSLLAALLGEMNKINGNVRIYGRIGYVPQSAWIFNATLKDNILFGCEFDRQRYNEIIQACALKPDLDVLPNGDRTEIGEKGINLSGGQRARVSLARALYNNADIYLLDDPLSAVDAHVSAHIFHHVIGPEGLLKDKTRILVTHGVAHLNKCDEILVMKEGEIHDRGSYNQLKTTSETFCEFVQMNLMAEESTKYTTELNHIKNDEIQPATTETNEEEKFIQKETVNTDSTKFSIIWKYIQSSSLFIWLFVLICFCLMIIVSMTSNIYLAKWTDKSKRNITLTSHSHMKVLNIYFSLGLLQGLFLLLMQLLQVITASSASVYLHQNLLKGVLHAPMSFFDCTPIGRIINRFAKDIDSLDNILPVSFSSTLTTLGSVLVTTSVLIYTSWYALIAIISLAIPFAFIQRVYVTSSRQLRQLDSTTKSPLYSNFTETLQGLSSIRAYKAQDRFIGINDDRLDHNQACFFASQVVCRWLGVRLEILANVLTFMTSLFAVFMRQHFTVGIIGLAITCTMQVTQSLGWLVLFISDIESNIVSVERIQEYTELDSEAPWQISDKQVDSQWPINGKIQIEDLSVKYRENLQTVINDINIEIEPGEKIGIVGRTGSGKTSLCMALFRIIEATKGKILIDNIDISRLGLHELRSKITIIPQDAVIFAGTVRFNVDPYEIYSDDEIWRVFESVHIKQRINGLTNGLLFTFTEGGNSLSAGEKQLLCMARALLRQSKIVVLDEATASIDMETDRLIQMTIRTALKDATVLTIAHRLHTILDSTRILVLSNGNLQEFDSPNNLVLNSHSFFTKLLQDANINLNNMNNSLI